MSLVRQHAGLVLLSLVLALAVFLTLVTQRHAPIAHSAIRDAGLESHEVWVWDRWRNQPCRYLLTAQERDSQDPFQLQPSWEGSKECFSEFGAP